MNYRTLIKVILNKQKLTIVPFASMVPCTLGWGWLGQSIHHLPHHPSPQAAVKHSSNVKTRYLCII
jgi:hypothetical protein